MHKTPYGYCGMPCALCNRNRTEGPSKCTGCSYGGYYGDSCKIKKCCEAKRHPHCALCEEYPCPRIQHLEDFGNLDTSGCWADIADDIQRKGFEDWHQALKRKSDMLTAALETYNDGRMKRFLCELFIQQDLDTLERIMEAAKQLEGSKKDISERFKRIVKGHIEQGSA